MGAHRGELVATTHSRLTLVQDEAFASVVGSHHSVLGSARRYASAFLAEVNKAERGGQLCDLNFEGVDILALVDESFPDADFKRLHEHEDWGPRRSEEELVEQDWST